MTIERVDSEVERLWVAALRAQRDWTGHRRPAAGMTRVIEALAKHGPVHEGELARRAGVNQANLNRAFLPKLARLGFAEADEGSVPGLGHQGGGRPARLWRLTGAGQRLAQAIEDER